jgi:hypothetical protein
VTPSAPKPDTTCTVCTGPLISVRDDPYDPDGNTHPSCAPVDRQRWERHLPETRLANERHLQRATGRGREAQQR